jgi:hypothetical protein
MVTVGNRLESEALQLVCFDQTDGKQASTSLVHEAAGTQGYGYGGGDGDSDSNGGGDGWLVDRRTRKEQERQKPSNHKLKMAHSCLERANERDANEGEGFIL